MLTRELYWKIVTIALGYIFGEAVVDIARAKTPPLARGPYFFANYFRNIALYAISR